ncbi:HlyD family secretion protein [Pedobacter mucosus]|uniref:HlyD family secretion protein n=1 Tax=Pedobacter mucosus TaxID=2895286 RepID=UPI001EE3D763|nr:HlyD family secretion protein [Pedobacter mucosus]UKT66001.1 HlyD family secretion protein [Pedobacter mucosus]
MNNKSQKISTSNLIITIISVLLIILGMFWFIRYLVFSSKYEETNDAQVESYINPVSARAGGFIDEVYFKDHQAVKQGDTLVLLDNREYSAQLLVAEAALEDANAQLKVLAAGISSSQIASSINRNQIQGAVARNWQQEQEIKRYKNLIAEEAATGADFDQVKSRYEVSVSDLDASKNGLKASQAKTSELETHHALLIADIKRKEAALSIAKLNLSYTVIRAPYSGQLGKKSIQVGQQIQPGQPLVSIIDEGNKWITANFKETQVATMHVGQTVEIKSDAFGGKIYKGKITAIAGSTGSRASLLPPDNSSGNFVKIIQRIPVKIEFTEKDTRNLVAGMNVTVSVRK